MNNKDSKSSQKVIDISALLEKKRLARAEEKKECDACRFDQRTFAVKTLILAIKRKALPAHQAIKIAKELIKTYYLEEDECRLTPSFRVLNGHPPVIEDICGADAAMYQFTLAMQSGLFEAYDACRLVRLIRLFYEKEWIQKEKISTIF